MIWRLLLPLAFIIRSGFAITTECHSSCASCVVANDSSACTSCRATVPILILTNDNYGICGSTDNCTTYGGLVLTNGSIFKCFIGAFCPPGYYKSASTCIACDKSCQECSGANSNQCLSCPDGKTLLIDFDDSGKCIDKTSCNGTLVSDGKLCVGSIKNATANCSSGCSTCYTNSSSHCKSCPYSATSATLIQTENYVSDERWGSCSSAISIKRKWYNFGFDPNNVTNQFKCHWTCQSCITENDPNGCTSCTNYAYLKVISEINGSPIGSCRPSCSSPGDLSLIVGNRKYCSSSGNTPLSSNINRFMSFL